MFKPKPPPKKKPRTPDADDSGLPFGPDIENFDATAALEGILGGVQEKLKACDPGKTLLVVGAGLLAAGAALSFAKKFGKPIKRKK